MESASRGLLIVIAGLGLTLSAAAQAPEKAKSEGKPRTGVPVENGEVDMDYVREELGVNEFTAPSIEHLLAELMAYRPVPIEKLWKDFKPDIPQDRAVIAMSSGRVIADGLLAVIAEKPSRIEPCARALVRYAKGLGVSEHLNKHTKSIIEKAARENWAEVRRELVRAQADVEAGMLALKDEEIAHLVSLGGWLRGLEIISALIADDYNPERARRLIQPEALAYFAERLGALNPRLKKDPLFESTEKAVVEIQKLIGKPDQQPPSLDDVKKVRKLAGEIVEQL